jgi:proteasome lid subunit RPN8/RPN11
LIKKKIEDHCLENPLEESCGIIFFSNKRTKVLPCLNRSENKQATFSISHKDFIECSKRGEIFGIYHSHVYSDAEFSEKDLLFSGELNLPYFVYSLKTKRHSVYIPENLPEKNKSFKNFLSRAKKDFSVKNSKE